MMQITKLRNEFLKQKTTETRLAYSKLRNICLSKKDIKDHSLRMKITRTLVPAKNFGTL